MCRRSDSTSLEKALSIFSRYLDSLVEGGIVSGHLHTHGYMLSEEFLNMDNVSMPLF